MEMVVYKKFIDPRTKAYEIYPVTAGTDPRVLAERQSLQDGEWDIADDEDAARRQIDQNPTRRAATTSGAV